MTRVAHFLSKQYQALKPATSWRERAQNDGSRVYFTSHGLDLRVPHDLGVPFQCVRLHPHRASLSIADNLVLLASVFSRLLDRVSPSAFSDTNFGYMLDSLLCFI